MADEEPISKDISNQLESIMHDIAWSDTYKYQNPIFLQDARKFCEYMITNYGEKLETHLTKGKIAQAENKLEQAIESFEKTLPYFSNTPDEQMVMRALISLNREIEDEQSAASFAKLILTLESEIIFEDIVRFNKAKDEAIKFGFHKNVITFSNAIDKANIQCKRASEFLKESEEAFNSMNYSKVLEIYDNSDEFLNEYLDSIKKIGENKENWEHLSKE